MTISSSFSPPSPTRLIYPAAFTMAFALMLANLGLIFFARDVHHATPGTIGWLAGMWALTYTAGCLLLRPRLKHIGAPAMVLIAALGLALVFAVTQVAPGLPALFALQGVYGFFLALYWPSLMGWLSTGVEGAELGRLVSRFNLMWSTGNIIGPYACGWLLVANVRLPLAVAAVLMLLIALYVSRAAGAHAVSAAATKATAEPAGSATDRSTPLRYPAWIGHFAAYLSIGAVMAVFPVAARDDLGYSESLIGLILLIRSLANTIAFIGMGHTHAWHFRLWPMLAGQGLAIVAFLALLGVRSTIAITALLCLANFAAGISYSASIFHGASGSLDRAHRMAIHEALIGIGLFAGSALGGMVYDATSLNGVYVMGAAVIAMGLVAQALAARMVSGRKSQVAGPEKNPAEG